MEIKFFEDIDRALGLSSFFVHEKVKSSTLNAHRQRRVSWCSVFALFDVEPVEVGEVFLAGVGEGEAMVVRLPVVGSMRLTLPWSSMRKIEPLGARSNPMGRAKFSATVLD